MRISQRGINMIKDFEGCKLAAYKDSVGIPTIGVGHVKGVKMGMKITQAQADKYLAEDLAVAEKCLNSLGVTLKQNQFDALCSFIFNLGVGNFNSSTIEL